MQFDAEKQVFILDTADRTALGVGDEYTEWPIGGIDHLLDTVTVSERLTDAMAAGDYPAGRQRNQMLAEQQFRLGVLRNMRVCIAQHASLTESDYAALFDQDS